MVAAPEPTAPPKVVDKRGEIAARTNQFTPLTAGWVAPASCATNIPTVQAGFCNTAGCTSYGRASFTSALKTDGATVNKPHYTTSNVMTSTACMPPGFQALQSFYFTGATGCPAGYLTASTSRSGSATKVACCPSNYPTAEYYALNDLYDCITRQTVTSGMPFTAIARGPIYSSVGGDLDYYSESVIGTTTWDTTAVTATITHPAIALMYGTNLPGTDASAAIAAAGFTLFSLGLGASIAIVVVFAVVGIALLVCLACCIRILCGRRHKTVNNTTTVVQAPGTGTAGVYAPVPQAPAAPMGVYTAPAPAPMYGAGAPQPYEPYAPYGGAPAPSPAPVYPGTPGQPVYGAKYPEPYVAHV